MVRWKEWELHKEIKTLAEAYLDLEPEGPGSEWARRAGCPLVETSSAGDPNLRPAPEAVAPDTTASVGGAVAAPVKIFAPMPPYSEWAKQARIQGTVILETIVDRQGIVRQVKVLNGLPLCLTEQAVHTVSTWKFKPATRDGRPVDVYFHLQIRFSLE